MMPSADMVIMGTGTFAARIVFDLAATASRETSVMLVGRNGAKLAWMRTAALARAAMFGTPLTVTVRQLETFTTAEVAALLEAAQPRVVVNTASIQGARKAQIQADGWTRLIGEAGLGVATLLQARISMDVARAMTVVPGAYFINCCYPDVVNPMLAAAGLPVTSGFGNIAILAHAFAGALGRGHAQIHLLAQHAALAAFRRDPSQRPGTAPLRLWLDGREVDDVFGRFGDVKLSEEPAIDISGASGVPLIMALAFGTPWQGHLPGPNGLPGGYPVQLSGGRLDLDLPPGLGRDEAIAWNVAFEEENGVRVRGDGEVRYTGKVLKALQAVSPDIAGGFSISSFDAAFTALSQLRDHLVAQK